MNSKEINQRIDQKPNSYYLSYFDENEFTESKGRSHVDRGGYAGSIRIGSQDSKDFTVSFNLSGPELFEDKVQTAKSILKNLGSLDAKVRESLSPELLQQLSQDLGRQVNLDFDFILWDIELLDDGVELSYEIVDHIASLGVGLKCDDNGNWEVV